MRATLQDFAWNLHAWLTWIIAGLFRRSAGIAGYAASLGFVGGMFRLKPVRSPLPYISDHVIKPIAVRGKRTDGRGAFIAIAAQVLPGKFALPRIRHVLPIREEFPPPCKSSTIETSAGGEFP